MALLAPQKAQAVVVVKPVTATYDGAFHGTTAEAYSTSGVDLGPVPITYSSTPVHAGAYTASATFPGNRDYFPATGSTTFVIDQATPSVQVDSLHTTYNGGPHTTTARATGVAGEDLGPVPPTYSIGFPPVHAGTYTASAAFPGNQDYTSATNNFPAYVVIDSAIPVATIAPVTERPYDGMGRGTTGQVLGVAGIVLANSVVYTDRGGVTLSSPPLHAGSYTATVSYPGDDDYFPASANTLIVIDKADLKITTSAGPAVGTIDIDPYFVTYDGKFHGLIRGQDGTARGVQGENLDSLLDLGIFAVDAGTISENWTFNQTGTTNPDYNLAQGLVPVIIYKAPLNVAVPNQAKTYGQAIDLAAALGKTIASGVNGETLNIAYASAGTGASAPVQAGGYAITAQLSNGTGKLSNYDVRVIPGTLLVNKAPLIITAKDQTKITGAANPAFTVNYSGFVLGQGPSVLGGALTFGTTATVGSPPGNYAVTPGGLTSGNYAITFAPGTLAVLSYAQATTNLLTQVNAANLPQGTRNSLGSQLQSAIGAFDNSRTTAGVSNLRAFINHVSAQRGKTIDVALADALIAYADWIINAIG